MISIFKITVNNFGINDLLFNIIAFGIALIMMRKNTIEPAFLVYIIPMLCGLATPCLNLHLGLSFFEEIVHVLTIACFMGVGIIIGRIMTRRPVVVPKVRSHFEIYCSQLYIVLLFIMFLPKIQFATFAEFFPNFYQQYWSIIFYNLQILLGIILATIILRIVVITRHPENLPENNWRFEIEGTYLYMVVLVFIWLTRIFFVLLKEFWPVFYQQYWIFKAHILQVLFGIIVGRSVAVFEAWKKTSRVSS